MVVSLNSRLESNKEKERRTTSSDNSVFTCGRSVHWIILHTLSKGCSTLVWPTSTSVGYQSGFKHQQRLLVGPLQYAQQKVLHAVRRVVVLFRDYCFCGHLGEKHRI